MNSSDRLTNRQSDIAERAGAAWKRYGRARAESIAAYLETGRLLLDARADAEHGEFGAILARAGIPHRTANRAMRLAESGAKLVTVTNLGIRRSLEALAEKPPDIGADAWLAEHSRYSDAVDRYRAAIESRVRNMLEAGRALARIRKLGGEPALRRIFEHPEAPSTRKYGLACIAIAESGWTVEGLAKLAEDAEAETPEALARAVAREGRMH